VGASAATLDPNNPLAAVAVPFRPSQRPSAPATPQAQRIEMDETVVAQARSGARKQGLIAGLVVAVLVGGVAWVGGVSSAAADARKQGVGTAHDLSGELLKAKGTLDQVKEALNNGGKSLLGDRKYPADLGKTLAGMNVDFSGDKLAGRRFSGIGVSQMHDLVDFITRVQEFNNKKDLIVSLLSRLKTPIEEELKLPPGQSPLRYVVLYDDSVDTGGTYLLPLVKPILPDDKTPVPDKLTFVNPKGGNSELPRLTDTKKVPKDGAVIPIIPPSFDKVCPSVAKGQMSQLLVTMNTLIGDIDGQKAQDASEDAKPGLSEIAQKLSDDLNKVN
jgi:hypothetical protein